MKTKNSRRKGKVAIIMLVSLLVIASFFAFDFYQQSQSISSLLDQKSSLLDQKTSLLDQQSYDLSTIKSQLQSAQETQNTKDDTIKNLQQNFNDLEQYYSTSQTGYTTLQTQFNDLQTKYNALSSTNTNYQATLNQQATIVAQYNQLFPIKSPELNGNGILIDTSLVFTSSLICTGSMEPTFGCSDVLIYFKPTSPTQIDVNDIIIFNSPGIGIGIVHRVIAVNYNTQVQETVFTTKGDANPFPDPSFVPFSSVTGKILSVTYDSST